MVRYPISEETGKPYGYPDDVIVDNQGYDIGRKNESHKKIDGFSQDLINISQDLIKSCQTKGAHPKELGELKDFLEKKIPELKRVYDDEKQKNEELVDILKRRQAEFENYKKRVEKEKEEFTKYAGALTIGKLLPVLDSFEIALKNTSDKEKFIEGIKMIYAQFHSMLEAEGLRPIKSVGEKFDPYRHEVLMKAESDKPDDTILEEFQKGYMLNDKVLRHSKVKISGR
ncbi:nucleotide exchange factor GrpE [Candidatus Woesearchaeota archaeon]|nr:nucleotide exchange factor GrpE [Candidatus Woesearchaeota archaeon]